MRSLPTLVLLGAVASAVEPNFAPVPGSEWLPRKSVQWPQPQSGYVTRALASRLCLADTIPKPSLTFPTGSPSDAAEIFDVAWKEFQAVLSRSGGRQLDCTKVELGDTGDSSKLIGEASFSVVAAIGNNPAVYDLGPEVDESYLLRVSNSGGIVAEAKSVFGIRHALTTLTNMLEVRNLSPVGNMTYSDRVPSGNTWHWTLPYSSIVVNDAPRLSHRGVMIDTARHYQEWDDLYKVVAGLSRAKMNVFHWHATDDQSFPLVLEKSKLKIHGPDCKKGTDGPCHGAYNPYMTYHQEDVVEFIKYARQHGVRVYIEIDQPSHARSWANLDTELRDCDTIDHQVEGYCVQPICGPLNLATKYKEVRALADSILEDWMALTPNEIVHIGMDEIGADCWGAELRDKLSAQWLEDSVKAIYAIDSKRDIMVWQDGLVFPTGEVEVPAIANKVMTQVWDRADDAQKYLEEGRDIIWSNYEGMYLDCGRGNTAIPTFNSWCGLYKTWWDVYKQTPDLTIDYDRQKPNVGTVRGGETPLWAEQTDTANIQTLLWPRVAAWGGAAWEARDKAPTDPQSVEAGEPILFAQHQLAAFSNMMAYDRGIRHTPMFVQWCIYEDEKLCDKFTDSYYTPKDPEPPGSSGASPTAAAIAVTTLLTALNL